MIISCDFDGTICGYDGKPLTKIINLLKEDISNGDNVIIVTRQSNNPKTIDFVKKYIGNIPVIFTSNQPKWKTLEKEHVEMHYDDDPSEIKLINDNSSIQTIFVQADTSKERIEAFKEKEL